MFKVALPARCDNAHEVLWKLNGTQPSVGQAIAPFQGCLSKGLCLLLQSGAKVLESERKTSFAMVGKDNAALAKT